MNTMPGREEVPEEAVETVATKRRGPNWKGLLRGKNTPARRLGAQEKKAEEKKVLAEIRADLEAAAPAIRNQERQQILEALSNALLARNLLMVEVSDLIWGTLGPFEETQGDD